LSLSNGQLALLRPDQSNGLSVTNTWTAHDFEPWTVAWDYWKPDVIFSGGDDLKMKAWDIRAGFKQPAVINKRFESGITSIQSHPNVEHIIAVGSYDNTVRIFDSRKLLVPLTQADTGGGAWRVRWHPSPNRSHDLLVAAMHAGFKVLRFPNIGTHEATWDCFGESWEVLKTFDRHQSLAYGVDWSQDKEAGEHKQTLIASASFYDHALHLWKG